MKKKIKVIIFILCFFSLVACKSEELSLDSQEHLDYIESVDYFNLDRLKEIEEEFNQETDFNEDKFNLLLDLYYKNKKHDDIVTLYNIHYKKIQDDRTKIHLFKILVKINEEDEEILEEIESLNTIESYEALMWYYALIYNEPKLRESIDEAKKINKNGSSAIAYEFILDNYEKIDKVALVLGNFLNKERKDIIVSYIDKNNPKMINYLLLNGLNGEKINFYRDKNPYYDYIRLENLKVENNLDKLVSIGRSGLSSNFNIYKISQNGFTKSDLDKKSIEDDLTINYIDDFKLKIESKKLKKRYIVDIAKADINRYIKADIFNEYGEILDSNKPNTHTINYSIDWDKKSDKFIETLVFGGINTYSQDKIAYLYKSYKIEEDSFELDDFYISFDSQYEKDKSIDEGVEVVHYLSLKNEDLKDDILYLSHLTDEDINIEIYNEKFNLNKDLKKIIQHIGGGQTYLIEEKKDFSRIYNFIWDGGAIKYLEDLSDVENHIYILDFSVNAPLIKGARGLEVNMTQREVEELYPLENPIGQDGPYKIYLIEGDRDSEHNFDLYLYIDYINKKLVFFQYVLNI